MAKVFVQKQSRIAINHTPRKSLGQHFLHQKKVIEQIIQSFNPQPSDTIVEIGPGLGALTYELLPLAGSLHVVELDRELACLLEKQTEVFPNLHVHNMDALKTDFCSLAEQNIRLIGNLPYNIATPLLFRLLAQRQCITDMYLMIQKEVGERLRAKPGSKQYGRLTVMVQQICDTRLIMRVDKGAFKPPPKVDSVVLRLIPYQDPPHPVQNQQAFARVVRVAFSQRRKTLRNALKSLIEEEQIAQLGIDPKLRPEQLGIEEYTRLSELLDS